MTVLQEYTSLRSGADVDTFFRPDFYALSNPTHGPGASDYVVAVFATTKAAVRETGTIAFGAVADVDDTVTINDGTASAVFTFKNAGDGLTGAAVQVAKGATATDSAQNLKAAIAANTTITVGAAGAAATLTLTNNRHYFGGAITKSDGDNDYVVTDFSGGNDGRRVIQIAYDFADGAAVARTYSGAAWGSWA